MNSDFKLDFGRVGKPHISTNSLLMEELKRIRKKLEIILFPFCELDCSWISVCTKIQTVECIINYLRKASKDLTNLSASNEQVQYNWH